MRLPTKDQKILWARSAGRCSFPNCEKELIIQEDLGTSNKLIGEIAHIIAKSNTGPRADPNLSSEYLNS